MPTPSILVAEDDAQLRFSILELLEEHGFQAHGVSQSAAIFPRLSQVDLLLLDLRLPGGDGLDILRNLRLSSQLPVIIVSARCEGCDRVIGLELGADDYLTKPFLPQELVARIRAVLRRTNLQSLQRSPLYLNSEKRTVYLEEQLLHLTPREYAVLQALYQAPGKTFTREELLEKVWGDDYLGGTRCVDLVVSRLRGRFSEKGHPALIRSVWGVGYRLESA